MFNFKFLIIFIFSLSLMAESAPIERFITYPMCLQEPNKIAGSIASSEYRSEFKLWLFCPTPKYDMEIDFINLKITMIPTESYHMFVLNDDLTYDGSMEDSTMPGTYLYGQKMVDIFKACNEDPEIRDDYQMWFIWAYKYSYLGAVLKSKVSTKQDIYFTFKEYRDLQIGQRYTEIEVINEIYLVKRWSLST